jgi:ferredoxin-NADP reductase
MVELVIFFFNMHPGDTVMSGRPRGNFILQNKSNYSRYILIATNSGVAPYRSMMQEIQNLMNTNTEIEVVLLFGIRKRENLFFKDDFLSFAKANPKFKFLICYSREDSIIDSSYERLGHVQDSLEELQLNAKKDIVYICGNPDMVNDVKAICFSKNFSNKNIIREKYSISKK